MMFLEGMRKPWWIAAVVVWVVTILALERFAGYDFTTSARIALVTGGLTAFAVWYALGRGRSDAPPSDE
jgi:hypothetical protein